MSLASLEQARKTAGILEHRLEIRTFRSPKLLLIENLKLNQGTRPLLSSTPNGYTVASEVLVVSSPIFSSLAREPKSRRS